MLQYESGAYKSAHLESILTTSINDHNAVHATGGITASHPKAENLWLSENNGTV